jgi:hypothetical protein
MRLFLSEILHGKGDTKDIKDVACDYLIKYGSETIKFKVPIKNVSWNIGMNDEGGGVEK